MVNLSDKDKMELLKLRKTEDYRGWQRIDLDSGHKLSASCLAESNGNNYFTKFRITTLGERMADAEFGLTGRESLINCLGCDSWFSNPELKVCGNCFSWLCKVCFPDHEC